MTIREMIDELQVMGRQSPNSVNTEVKISRVRPSHKYSEKFEESFEEIDFFYLNEEIGAVVIR